MTAQFTNRLQSAPGVQYQGVIDNSAMNRPAIGMAVVVGRFRRGPVGRLFTVTRETMRATLGHDPSNRNYIVVRDILESGAGAVTILRLRDRCGIREQLLAYDDEPDNLVITENDEPIEVTF